MASSFVRSKLLAVGEKVAATTPQQWASFIAALPVLIWTHDSFYTLCRVRGSSMNPTLKEGDIILIRRSDHMWQKQLKRLFNQGKGGGEGSENNSNKNEQEDEFNIEAKQKEEERQKVKDFERNHCSQNDSPIWVVKKPPVPATGDVVVFLDPTDDIKAKWNIKRVIGLGGQVLMMPSNRYYDKISSNEIRYRMGGDDDNDDNNDRSMRIVTSSVPPYSIWIEGDNTANSIDSKSHGPISKKLMLGIAEYIIWPPSRFSSSLRGNVNPSKQPRAYWP